MRHSLVKERLLTLIIALIVAGGAPYATDVRTKIENYITIHTQPPEETQRVDPEKGTQTHIIVTLSCDTYYRGACVRIRSGPGTDYPVITRIRNGAVFEVGPPVHTQNTIWYPIMFNEWLRYPERVVGEWYISGDFVTPYTDKTSSTIITNPSAKKIIIHREEQMLYAYENNTLVMRESVSTGIEQTPTPRGEFTVYRKTPSRYMQGPIPEISEKYYDLPGVPWNLYFTEEGAVIHGAYWHDNFGVRWSNGCVNLPPEKAKLLYEWADTGTKVLVQD
jgi:lipoprotein-anchoring transpeptidase ErfK/SrfK